MIAFTICSKYVGIFSGKTLLTLVERSSLINERYC